jgi:branched-chain amino acid transport system ATP-binding protein
MDEPTTGLDQRETAHLLDVLKAQRAAGTTILLVAHDVRFVMGVCDHVYVLAEGKLLFEGPPAVAQRDARVIEAYLGRSA